MELCSGGPGKLLRSPYLKPASFTEAGRCPGFIGGTVSLVSNFLSTEPCRTLCKAFRNANTRKTVSGLRELANQVL